MQGEIFWGLLLYSKDLMVLLVGFSGFAVTKAAAKALRNAKQKQFACLTFFRPSAGYQMHDSDQVKYRVSPPVGLVHCSYA